MTLVLRRRVGEVLVLRGLGGEVRVTVMDVREGQVQVAIEAPEHVRVRRAELDGPGEKS